MAKTSTTSIDTITKDIRIVVLHRSYVVIGEYYKDGTECRIENGFYIRQWGTASGLGQLAKDGPQTNTILDPATTIRVHELAVIHTLDCNSASWAKQWK